MFINENELPETPTISTKNENEIIEVERIPQKFRQSNWFLPMILQMDTYPLKIFSAITSVWNSIYLEGEFIEVDEKDKEGNLTGKKIKVKDWNPIVLSKNKKTIIFKTSELMKELGFISENGSVSYNTEFLDDALDKLNNQATIKITDKLKKEAPEIYDAVVKNLIHNRKNKQLKKAYINLFQVWRTGGQDGEIGFNIFDEAVPFFDSISKNWLGSQMESIRKIGGLQLTLYHYLKKVLGDAKNTKTILYFNPSETNEYHNMRFITNNTAKDANGEFINYKNDEAALYRKTMERSFQIINDECPDIYVDYKNKKAIKKNRKMIAVELPISSINPKFVTATITEIPEELLFLEPYFSNSQIEAILSVIQSDSFKEKHFNKAVMTDEIFYTLTIDYLKFCFEFIKKRYYRSTKNQWDCNPIKMLCSFLWHGGNIYDGQMYKYNSMTQWTSSKDVNAKNIINNDEEYIKKEVPPSFLKFWDSL